jgi:hypothetical protein
MLIRQYNDELNSDDICLMISDHGHTNQNRCKDLKET